MLQFEGSSAVTFQIVSPIANIAELKYMRVGTTSTIKALEGSKTMFKWKNNVLSGRALQNAADSNYIKIISVKE